MEGLFYKVNTNLAIELCKEAKANGVKQFIYMSSMNVLAIQVNAFIQGVKRTQKTFMVKASY